MSSTFKNRSSAPNSLDAQHPNTQRPKVKWDRVHQPSKDDLRNRIVRMYWEGAAREVVCMVRTLHSWRQERFAGVTGEDEELSAKAMQGFQTFLERAVGVGREKIRNAIRETILQMERDARGLSIDQRRARMLLQGAGFLDIDKIIEYLPPLKGYGLWVQPRAAQLTLADYDPNNHLPNFRPSVCSNPECSSTIRGVEFRCLSQTDQIPPPEKPSVFCEKCSRDDARKTTGHLRKYEKRCILREVVPHEQIRQICSCGFNNSPQNEEGRGGDEDVMFAVDGGQTHLPHCPILQLKQRHEQAKLDELEYRKKIFEETRRKSVLYRINSMVPKKQDSILKLVGERALGWAAKSIAPPNTPFGNVHMALMVGTIIIENGVPGSKRGALISIRDSPVYYSHPPKTVVSQLSISPGREVFSRKDSYRELRIKACMKQVVGGVFTGLSNEVSELEIIDALAREGQRYVYDPMKARCYDDARLEAAAHRIVLKLQVLLGARVTRYFDILAEKLFTVELRLNKLTNSCQQFCANILDFRTFGSFLATTPTCRQHTPARPLYLVSFTCAPGSYDSPRRVRPQSKRDAPNGLTEEYLLRFRRYGHHEESDIIDTLLEYWHDWGAFGGPIYRHQDLFPWDCTEAYRMGEDNGKCNNCNMASHVWSFPFDAWSIVQLHLLRERAQYSPHPGSTRERLSDEQWMRNRLTALSALNALNTVAVAMAKTPSFRAACHWNRERNALTPDTASKLDRIKLSGIHRAQPYSHDFEKAKYHDCTLADWALLKREDQIRAYEAVRDHRADEQVDIPPARKARKAQYRPRHLSQARNDAGTESSMQDNNLVHHHDKDHDRDSRSDIHNKDEDYATEGEGYAAEDTRYEPGPIPDSFGADPCDDPNDYTGLCGCNDDGRDDDEYDNFGACAVEARDPQYEPVREWHAPTSLERGVSENPGGTERALIAVNMDELINKMLEQIHSPDPGTRDPVDFSDSGRDTGYGDDSSEDGGFFYGTGGDSYGLFDSDWNNNNDSYGLFDSGWNNNNDSYGLFDSFWNNNNDSYGLFDGGWNNNNDSGWFDSSWGNNNDSGWFDSSWGNNNDSGWFDSSWGNNNNDSYW